MIGFLSLAPGATNNGSGRRDKTPPVIDLFLFADDQAKPLFLDAAGETLQ